MNREPEKKFHQLMVHIGDSLSDLPSSDDADGGEDKDDKETEHGQLREDDEPDSVMGTITYTLQQYMERFLQKQMKLNKLTQLGWGDAVNYFCERVQKYSTTSVSNGSNQLVWFLVRVGTGTEPLQQVLPHNNQKCCNWAGFTTQNPAFQPYNVASNSGSKS